MDTFTNSLSYDEQTIVLYNGNEQSIVPYNDESFEQKIAYQDTTAIELSSAEETLTVSKKLPLAPHPFIIADRNKALQTLSSALSAARNLRQKFEESLFSGPACPYQRTLIEYLGPNFICPTIHDLTYPRTFDPPVVVKAITAIDKKYNDLMLTHLRVMSAEAADTKFPGITSQNLGNAFAVLSTTSNGQEYVVDKNKASQHLEFVEMIRNIPTDYILQNPIEVAQKLIGRYMQIHLE